MKTVIPFPDRSRIREEASAWVVRLNGDPLAEDEKARLKAWLDADPLHREALHKLAHVWNDMACMTVLAELFPLEPEPGAKGLPRQGMWSRTTFGAAVATLAAVALTLSLVTGIISPWPETQPVELVYQTATGQQSEVLLKDGSTLTLNTGSEARVRFDGSERGVYLTRGEAHFEVAKNPELPFVVHAGSGSVRAIGTAFNVRLTGERVGVLVEEGTVEVVADTHDSTGDASSPNATGKSSVRLTESGTASYTTTIGKTTYLPREELEQQLAWRKGKWMFEGETLAEVIAEVSRYTDKEIEIIDPAIASLRIGGYFDIGEIDGLMNVLQAGFGIRVTRIRDDHIQLSALAPSTPQ